MKLDKTLFNTVNKWKLATCLLAILTVLGSSLYIYRLEPFSSGTGKDDPFGEFSDTDRKDGGAH